MSRAPCSRFLATAFTFAALLASALTSLDAAENVRPPAAAGEVVSLPPMIVADTAGSAVWLYASSGRDELLSRCSADATRAFLTVRDAALQRLRALVPDAFLAELPSITVIYDQPLAAKADDAVARELLHSGTTSAIRFLPNLRLEDRDLAAIFAYVDPSSLSQSTLNVTASHLRFLLEKRAPMLPPWLVEGLLGLHADLDPNPGPALLRPLVWLSETESRALLRNPQRPRALLSTGEMFAADVLRGPGNQHPQRAPLLAAQLRLFVRWALDPRNQVQAAFWEFARLAAEERVDEALFFHCFGFGYSDLRDRLNDYLPRALADPLPLASPIPLASPTVPPRLATPEEIARLRGEWERLEITHVQRHYRSFAAGYIAQARRTLHRAYDQGDRDPRLLTALGLCEIDAGDAPAAVPFLTLAVAAGTHRPRVSYELARLHFADLLRDQPANRLFSPEELAPVVTSLRRALTQSPQLPEIYGLLADAWLRCRTAPSAEDLAALERGARNFALHPTVAYRLAFALARYGKKSLAADLLAAGVDYVTDEALRARYLQLQSALTKPAAAKP